MTTELIDTAPAEVRELVAYARTKPELYRVADWPTDLPKSALFPEGGGDGPQTGWSIATERLGLTVWLSDEHPTETRWLAFLTDDEGERHLTIDMTSVLTWLKTDPTGVESIR